MRGFRIELGEVEAALAARAGGRGGGGDGARGRGARAPTSPPGWWRRGGGRLEVAALRAALRERLPEHMVPTAWRLLDALPLTANGKVDRRALLALAGDGRRRGAAELGYCAPRGAGRGGGGGDLRRGAAASSGWGRDDDFFALGGHSLLATRVVSRLRRAFAVEPEVRTLLERPTVAALAAWVSAARRGGARRAAAGRGARGRGRRRPPLSFAQERLWFLYQLAPESTLYNLPMVFRLDGPLRADALAAALAGVERRHAVLRTVFAMRAGLEEEPVQVVLPPASRPLPRVDLAGLPAAARAAEAGRLAPARSRAARSTSPAGRSGASALLRLGAEEHRLLVSLHHIAADGWSVEVLLRELAAL